MRLLPLILPALLASACVREAAEPVAAASASGAPAAADAVAGSDPAAAAEAFGDRPAAPPPAAQQPKRAPEFHFEDPAVVPDADLAQFHVVMSVAVDGADAGAMTFALWPEKAPKTVRNFLRYCDEGFYDGLSFHRVIRSFMVQGGSSTGEGSASGPNGPIPAEFSLDPRWNHRYGVLSMARSGDPDSASSQFFIVCGESASTAGLNGKYASFGRLVDGVAALEALAEVPVGVGRDTTKPKVPAKIVAARVVRSPAPAPAGAIERPPVLDPAPLTVAVQHILISFKGTRTKATRSKEEAEKLAAEVLAKVEKGEDFVSLLKQHSDDVFDPQDPNPSVYKMHATDFEKPGVFAAYEKLQAGWYESLKQKETQMRAGQAKVSEWLAAMEAKERAELFQALGSYVQPPAGYMPRNQLVAAFGDVGFALAVGEVGVAAYDAKTSPFGWHIIRRVE